MASCCPPIAYIRISFVRISHLIQKLKWLQKLALFSFLWRKVDKSWNTKKYGVKVSNGFKWFSVGSFSGLLWTRYSSHLPVSIEDRKIETCRKTVTYSAKTLILAVRIVFPFNRHWKGKRYVLECFPSITQVSFSVCRISLESTNISKPLIDGLCL